MLANFNTALPCIILSCLPWLMCYNIICYNASLHNVTYKYIIGSTIHTFGILYITNSYCIANGYCIDNNYCVANGGRIANGYSIANDHCTLMVAIWLWATVSPNGTMLSTTCFSNSAAWLTATVRYYFAIISQYYISNI